MFLNAQIQRTKRKQVVKVKFEYCTVYILFQGHLRKTLSPFASSTKDLGFLLDIFSERKPFLWSCAWVTYAQSVRHEGIMLWSALLDLSFVHKLIILQGSFHSMKLATQWVVSYLIVFLVERRQYKLLSHTLCWGAGTQSYPSHPPNQ